MTILISLPFPIPTRTATPLVLVMNNTLHPLDTLLSPSPFPTPTHTHPLWYWSWITDLPDVVRILAKDIHRSYQELLEQHGLTESTTITSWESKGGNEEGNDGLFKVDREAVEKRILAQRDQKYAESKEKFDAWKDKKVEEKKASVALAHAKKQQTKQETKEKRDKAEKAYKKWLKLQKKNTYVSKIDGKKRKIPGVKTCEHPLTWSKETDLADYHVENDRRFY